MAEGKSTKQRIDQLLVERGEAESRARAQALLMAGLARGRFKIAVPSHSGPEEYERYVRAHQNTLEHLVLFLPGMWLFAYVVSPYWAAGIGGIWPFMRVLYARGYHRAAEKRLLPLYISMPPIYTFVLGSLIGGIVRVMQGA